MLAFDGILREASGRGNVCALALTFRDAAEVERCAASISVSPEYLFLHGLRLRSSWARPAWRSPARALERSSPLVCALENDQLPNFIAHHDIRPDRDAPFQVAKVHLREGGAALIFFWHHALTDARGGEFIVSSLLADERFELELPARSKRQARRADMLALRRHIFAAGADPLRSAAARRPGPVRTLRYADLCLSAEETRLIDARRRELGAEMFPSAYSLAASARAFHTLCDARRDPPGDFHVIVPHSLRRPLMRRPISNDSSYLFFRIAGATLDSLQSAVHAVLDQSLKMIGEGRHLACPGLLDAARWIPLPVYRRLLGMPTRGKFASFYFSDVGEMFALRPLRPAAASLAACEHFAPHYLPPGLSVIFSRTADRLRIHVPFSTAVISSAEVDQFLQLLRGELLGISRVSDHERAAI